MNTDKVLALAREADFSEAETWLYADRMGRFAALLQREMEAENAELRKDEERYRWLREQCAGNGKLTIAIVKEWELLPWSGDDTDAAIDRARSANE